MMGLIDLNVPVQRDDKGWWSNPAIPDFDEDHGAYLDWLREQGIEVKWDLLVDEDQAHPAVVEYYEKQSGDVSAWDCRRVDSEGWHTFFIEDSEDGPIWAWARRATTAVGGIQQ